MFTQYIFNYKINKFLFLVYNDTTVFYMVGKYLKYP